MIEGKIIEKFFVEKNGKKMKIIFRYPRMNDAKDLLEYINSLVEEHAFIATMRKKTLHDEKKFLKQTISSIKKKESVAIVLEINNKAVSICEVAKGKLDTNKHTAEIGIGIKKEFRGLGLGKKTVNVLEKLAKKHLKTEILTLCVYSDNRTALSMYKKSGFVESGKIQNGCKHYGNYYDNIIMVKKL